MPGDNLGGRAILSLDAAKAFDSVKWPYLWEIVSHFGLGKTINLVYVIYSDPRARMRINVLSTLPSAEVLDRGGRQ